MTVQSALRVQPATPVRTVQAIGMARRLPLAARSQNGMTARFASRERLVMPARIQLPGGLVVLSRNVARSLVGVVVLFVAPGRRATAAAVAPIALGINLESAHAIR